MIPQGWQSIGEPDIPELSPDAKKVRDYITENRIAQITYKTESAMCRALHMGIDRLQDAVDGYIETIGLKDGGVMIADEEGLLKDKPYNKLASLVAGTDIRGTALIVGADGDEFDDVPEQYLPLLSCGEV